jgi:hypothetical protein
MRILNLGAGVQSTTVFLMPSEGLLPPFDWAIFADTQEEPEDVYKHLAWLNSLTGQPGFPIIIMNTAGKLGDDLMKERDPSHKTVFPYKDHHKHRFASIPCFTATHHDKPRSACSFGMVQRQCTKEYKIEVIEKVIRRQILGLEPRQRIPKRTEIDQFFGISWDERKRAERIRRNYDSIKWANVHFPLIDMKMTRDDCQEWLKNRVPHEVPRSACVFCPYKTSAEWLRLKEKDQKGWARAVEIDNGLRDPSKVVNRNMEQSLYLHRQCIPLEMVDLEAAAEKEAKKKATPLFALMDCGEGMCGV